MAIELPEYIEARMKDKLDKVVVTIVDQLPETPHDVFVSIRSTEGRLDYRSIWLFTPNLLVEIRNPINPQSRIQYEFYQFKRAVDWIRLYVHGYDFRNATEVSRLEIEFSTAGGLSGELSAIGPACQDLLRVYQERFLPNFIDMPED